MKTQTITTISRANQTAVPAMVRRRLGLEPGDSLLWQIQPRTKTVQLKPAPQKWGQQMRGLGKEIWRKTDTQKYLTELRKDRSIR